SPLHQDEQFVGVGGGITAAYGNGQVRVRDGDRTVHQDLIVSGARRRTLQFGGEGAGRLQNQVSGDREGAGGGGRARGEGAGGADGHRALDRSGAAEGLVGGELEAGAVEVGSAGEAGDVEGRPGRDLESGTVGDRPGAGEGEGAGVDGD